MPPYQGHACSRVRATPGQNIPSWLMDRAYECRDSGCTKSVVFVGAGMEWRAGIARCFRAIQQSGLVSLTGGSVGWQIGAQAADVVLIFATRRSLENFGRGQFTLGVGASVAAGRLGRAAKPPRAWNADLFLFASRGLFAGVALDARDTL